MGERAGPMKPYLCLFLYTIIHKRQKKQKTKKGPAEDEASHWNTPSISSPVCICVAMHHQYIEHPSYIGGGRRKTQNTRTFWGWKPTRDLFWGWLWKISTPPEHEIFTKNLK